MGPNSLMVVYVDPLGMVRFLNVSQDHKPEIPETVNLNP